MRFQKITFTILSLLFFVSIKSFAQDEKIVTWKVTPQKVSENIFKVTFTGTIKKGWHIYSTANKEAELAGLNTTTEDSSGITKSNFKILSKSITPIKDVFVAAGLQIVEDSITFTEEINFGTQKISSIPIFINYEVADATSFYPESDTVKIPTGITVVAKSTNTILIPTIQVGKPLTNCKTTGTTSNNDTASKGLLSIFILGFLGGLVALLTPCVFPMIPLTVSFFTKKAESKKLGIRNAFLYGFFIFLIYVLITIPFHIFSTLSPEIFNNISTNVYLNIIFFIVFVLFALSFFGLYEITLPSSLTNSTDSKANAGTVMGIFFMALTLTIVSFSCTGPLAGSLLAGAVSGEGGAMRLTFGMAGFGVALGIPFALFAMFPGMLKSLPKSGGWLTTVKVVLGFLELGLALKFLSNADLVKHWGLLKREIFIGIWIIIGVLLSLYLWGIFKFKNDSPIKKLGGIRIGFALFFTALTIYLLPGVTNSKYANLKLISGFPPPLYYSIYAKGDCILNLNCAHDYETGVKMAKEQNKAILLDFTGYACTNCRRMEENVWSNEAVYKTMSEKYIVVSLYVDDKKLLPAENRFTYTTKDGAKREIKTVGDKWSVFETENFNKNSQPLYAVINTNQELVSVPADYTPDAKDYLNWLECSYGAAMKK
jgi:thiol:disulfide interchange protein